MAFSRLSVWLFFQCYQKTNLYYLTSCLLSRHFSKRGCQHFCEETKPSLYKLFNSCLPCHGFTNSQSQILNFHNFLTNQYFIGRKKGKQNIFSLNFWNSGLKICENIYGMEKVKITLKLHFYILIQEL